MTMGVGSVFEAGKPFNQPHFIGHTGILNERGICSQSWSKSAQRGPAHCRRSHLLDGSELSATACVRSIRLVLWIFGRLVAGGGHCGTTSVDRQVWPPRGSGRVDLGIDPHRLTPHLIASGWHAVANGVWLSRRSGLPFEFVASREGQLSTEIHFGPGDADSALRRFADALGEEVRCLAVHSASSR